MKQAAPFFLSYARRDLAGVKRLRGVLAPLLRASAAFRFEKWIDQQILPGERWRVEIVGYCGDSIPISTQTGSRG
jgi:hypothetical protein